MGEFSFPRSLTNLYTIKADHAVAHNLDFDLVCVGPDSAEAKSKLTLAIQAYIQYGLERDLMPVINRPAPAEFWDQVLDGGISGVTETINVWDQRIFASAHEIRDIPIEA